MRFAGPVSKLHATATNLYRPGIKIPSAGTVAKFIIKSSLLLLSLNNDCSARK
ncbi:MAG TPA: hypothetical protein VN726_07735 [Hanamia sp.]|nr:hypothetical protein [Hanamia sp.]